MGLMRIGDAMLDPATVTLAAFDPVRPDDLGSARLRIQVGSGETMTLRGATAVAVWGRLCRPVEGPSAEPPASVEPRRLDDSGVAMIVHDFAKARRRWTGTYRELLTELERFASFDAVDPPPDWPSTPRGLSAVVRGHADALARAGIGVHFHRSHRLGRRLDLFPTSNEAEPRNAVQGEEASDASVGRYGSRSSDEAVLQALRANPEGLTRTQISRICFHSHKTAVELARILTRLTNAGRIIPPARDPDDLSSGRGGVWTLKDETTD